MLRLAFVTSHLVGTTIAITTDTNLRKETVENGLAKADAARLEVDAAGAMLEMAVGARSLVAGGERRVIARGVVLVRGTFRGGRKTKKNSA